VAGGGALVYASEHGDARLDFELGVVRRNAIASGDAVTAGPMLAGVRRVAGAPTVEPLMASSSQVTVLRSVNQQPVAVEELIGRGRMIVLADPLPLCNGHLEQADNGRLAADLVSLAPPGAPVAFDEYHHAVPIEPSPLTGWLSTPWGAAIAWAVLVLFAGLLLRGRAFGPRQALPGGGDRSSAEYVSAVGGLLQRSRAARLSGELLAGATRRALGARYGISTGAGFQRSLRSRSPLAAAELEAAEAELGRDGAGESGLLAGARRLHGVAYPEHPQE
jgi:hypothetical protein